MRLSYKWKATLVVALGLFMAVLDNTIVSVALPQMADAFHTSFETITWVATAYFLAQAAVIPVIGYLSDRVGTKAVFIVALALFTLGSGLCALAPSEEMLIAFRVLQGVGGGALFPMAFAIVFRVFPPEERGPASAVVGVPVLLAPAFGPTIGGYLTTTFDWSAIFTVNVPIGVVALILASVILHGRHQEQVEAATRGQRFDVLGLALSMAGFTALVYGITDAGQYGWSDTTVVRFLIAGAALLIAFVVVELRVSDPVIDLRLFANYTFTMANLVTWSLSAFLFGSLFLLPFFFENVQGRTALTAGEILISQGLAAAVGTIIAGRLYNRVGPRWLTTAGLIAVTAGTFGFTSLTIGSTAASVQIWLILRGLGLGLSNTPLQTLVLSVVSNRAMARASSLVTVTRQVFGAVGVSALTTYLTQRTAAHAPSVTHTFTSTILPKAQAACVATAGQNVAAIKTCVQQAAQRYIVPHAAVLGLNDTFTMVMIGCGVTVVLALIVGRDPAVEAIKRARARGEEVNPQPVVIGE